MAKTNLSDIKTALYEAFFEDASKRYFVKYGQKGALNAIASNNDGKIVLVADIETTSVNVDKGRAEHRIIFFAMNDAHESDKSSNTTVALSDDFYPEIWANIETDVVNNLKNFDRYDSTDSLTPTGKASNHSWETLELKLKRYQESEAEKFKAAIVECELRISTDWDCLV